MEEQKEKGRPARAKWGHRKLSPHSNPAAPCADAGQHHASGVGPALPMPEYISSEVFGVSLLKVLLNSRTPLGNFVRQSFDLHMLEPSHCAPRHLWPCPIPESIRAPSKPLKGRRRARFKLRGIIREHLRAYVASCNWLVLGRPKAAVAGSSSRQPSASQSRMLLRLECSLREWYRQSSGFCSDLSRTGQKFASLHQALSELSVACSRLRRSFDPYSKPSPFKANSEEASAPEPSHKPVKCKVQNSTTTVDLEPSRLKFSHSPSFKAERFLNDPFIKAGFLNPKHFYLPKSLWPKDKLARVMCDKITLLELFRKWDDVHSLHLVEASSSEFRYRCGLFAVYKSAEKDRQILNPIPENNRSFSIAESTQQLSHGTLLCGLYLEPEEDLVIGANDLEDFYHCFQVSPAHAARNHIHGVFPAEAFKGWNCWDPSLAGKHVVGCFRTLAMGTNYAVEVAQHTHMNLLRRAGCLKKSQLVQYRHPLPRGKVQQLLCIDDYAVIQHVPRGLPLSSIKTPRNDLDLMSKAERAYEKENLRVSKKKAVKNCKKSIVLGAQIDGQLGVVRAPGIRVLAL